jgi:YVTN family beta-propeller protein
MRLLDGFSRAGVVRLTGVLVAAVAVAACCIGVSSAAAEGIRTIPVGSGPLDVSSDGTHVWVTNFGEETVSEIDASSGTVIRTIPVGRYPFGVSSDGTHVWVANTSDGTVSEIEASSGTVIRTIPVGSLPYGVSSDGTHVWVTNDGEDTVSEIKASSGTVIRTIPVGSHPYDVSSDGTHAWVTNATEDTVSEIKASSGTVIRTVPVGSGPVAVSSDGTHVWVTSIKENAVTHAYEGTVSEIEASSGTVIRTIPVGSLLYGVSSDGTHVWVTDAGEDTVSEIEASSGTVIRTIHLGSGSQGVSSDGTHVWVANTGEGTVSEIPTSYAAPQPQSITFTSTAPANPTVGSVYPVAATAPGGPVSFSTVGACTVSNGTVSFPAPGPCEIIANQAGDSEYEPAPPVHQTTNVTASKAATVTSLSLTQASVEYGSEQNQTANVAITSAGGGVIPSGSIAVKSGMTVVCTATITNGAGSCSLAATAVKPGSRSLTAYYTATTHFGASKSTAASFTVVKDPSATTLSLSSPSAVWGSEQSEVFTVAVTAGGSITPTGSVKVKKGTTTLCTVTLSGGTGKCSMTATKLPKVLATYSVEAAYAGSTTVAASTSSSSSLEITP